MGCAEVLWKKGRKVKGVKSLLRNYIRTQCRFSGFFNMVGMGSKRQWRGGEGTRGKGMRGEELKLENPADGSTHHIMGVLGVGPESSVCAHGPVLRTRSYCCSL